LPSAEGLLQQLRVDARALENAGPFGNGKDSAIPENYFERQAKLNNFHIDEQGILAVKNDVTAYTADDLKNIGD
jgi:hypothetical protein